MLVAVLAPASYVSGAELLGHFFGVVICDVVGGDWVGHGVQLWASAVVVGPVTSFGAYGWCPERQGGCGYGLFVDVCLIP